MTETRWTIIVALKALPAAKSRLAHGRDPIEHARLVEAIRTDTLAVAAQVGRVFVVLDEAAGAGARAPRYLPPPDHQLVQTGTGLNAAIRDAALAVAARWPSAPLAALVGDLPALGQAELLAALELAEQYPRAFVADHSGQGTTLLTAQPQVGLRPAFGVDSAARHARIATLLPAGAGLRLDVDTAADLEMAINLGVGPATRTVLGH